MNDPYFRLFTLPVNLHTTDCPILISAGALLRKNSNGKVLAQLKIKNIQRKMLQSVKVELQPLDQLNQVLGDPITHEFLDLAAARDAEFGQQTPIYFSDNTTRAYTVRVLQVVFSDHSVWNGSESTLEPLKSQQTAQDYFKETIYDTTTLTKQYEVTYGLRAKYIYAEDQGLWFCACGAINQMNEEKCYNCNLSRAEISAVDFEALKEARNKRVEEELAQAKEFAIIEEEDRKEQEEKRETLLKRVGIVCAVVAVFFLASNIFSSFQEHKADQYFEATNLLEEGKFEEAILLFEKLGGYEDSEEQLKEAKYELALGNLTSAETREEGLKILEELDDYKDSKDILADPVAFFYKEAKIAMDSERYGDAMFLLDVIKDESEKYNEGLLESLLFYADQGFYDRDTTQKLEEYFLSHKKDFKKLDESGIRNLIKDPWISIRRGRIYQITSVSESNSLGSKITSNYVDGFYTGHTGDEARGSENGTCDYHDGALALSHYDDIYNEDLLGSDEDFFVSDYDKYTVYEVSKGVYFLECRSSSEYNDAIFILKDNAPITADFLTRSGLTV